jgi:hypothetical protein
MDLKSILGKIATTGAKAGVSAAENLPGAGPLVQAFAPQVIKALGDKIDPAAKPALDAAAAAVGDDLQKAELDHNTQIAQITSANLTADSSSNDSFVRRARPAFLWVITIGVAFSVVVFPVINALMGKGLVMPEIPSAYLDLFGVAFLGYTGARSIEKMGNKA